MVDSARTDGETRIATGSASVSLTTDELDTAEARERWECTLNSLYGEMDVNWPVDFTQFDARWAGHQFGDIPAADHTVVRSPEMIRSDGNQDFLLCMVADGYVEMRQGGRTATLEHGSFGILDCSQPFTYHCPNRFRQVVARLPRTSVVTRMSPTTVASATARTVGGTSGVGSIVSAVLNEVATLKGSLTAGSAAALSESTLDILATALAEVTAPVSATAEAHRRDLQAAKQALRRNLHDPDYSLHDVTAELGMSVRYIQVLFASSGITPRAWLHQTRLDRARNLLLTSDLTVAEVTASTGFRDVSHFSRSFRSRFGRSPGAYRTEHLTGGR